MPDKMQKFEGPTYTCSWCGGCRMKKPWIWKRLHRAAWIEQWNAAGILTDGWFPATNIARHKYQAFVKNICTHKIGKWRSCCWNVDLRKHNEKKPKNPGIFKHCLNNNSPPNIPCTSSGTFSLW